MVGKSSCLALLSAVLLLLLGASSSSHAAPALAGARVSPSQLDNVAPASIVNQGWLELHSSKHRQDPYVLGTNLIAAPESSNLDPLTAADDPFTSLQAVFVKGFDGALWGRWQVTTREGWGSWISFGSPNGAGLKSIPKAITNVNSLVSVFAVANDDQVYHITQLKDATFSNWTLVGSLLSNYDAAGSSYPTVVKAKNGRLFAYVTVNGYVHETHEDTPGSGKWTTWVTRVMGDSQIKGTVSVALNTFTGYLEAFAVLNDGCIYQAWQNDDESWRGWKALWECWSQPTRFSSNVAIHSMTGSAWNGDLEIFARGDDNKIWHTWQTTCVPHTNPWSRCTWGAYYSEANDCPAPNNGEMVDIEVGSNIHGGLEVFVTGTNGHLYHIWQLEMWGGWSSSWQDLSHPARGLLSSQPRVVHDRSGWWMAYVRGHDGDLEIYVQKRTMKIAPRIVPYGTPIQISWEVPEDEACNDDWLAVYQPQANNDKYLDFVYVQGEPNPGNDPVRNGNLNFGLYLPKGWYEVRYNVNRQPKDVLRTLFKISSDSDLLPAEQIFSGLVVGLGERGWDFENCTNDLVATFKTFELAFLHFHNKEIYEGLQALGQGIMDFADSMKACSDIYLAEKIEKFARDLIACTTGFCARFIISLVADILVIYMNRVEIWRDIEAATNDFEIFAYENAGVKIGDFIQAIIR